MVGRQILLQQLKQALYASQSIPLVPLHGLPGVGKTTLAVTLACDPVALIHFPDGILWAGLGPQPDLLGHLSRWGTLLGITLKETAQPDALETWAMAIHTAIGSRRMLIVIDDAWQLDAILACKVGGPRCTHLVTTRFPHLAVSAGGNSATRVPELSEQDGFALLESLAPEAVRQDTDNTHRLVRAVGGLPLALALMGKYLQVQAYSGQPRRLQNAIEQLQVTEHRLHIGEPRVITSDHPGLPPGATLSLQSVIAVSDQQLDGAKHQALLALSVFPPKPNSFSEEEALAVCASSVEMLDTLYDAGLLESYGPGRYTLHQSIADYARVNCSCPDIRTTAQKRLAIYTASYAEQHQKDYEALELESGNILVALEAAYMEGWQAELVKGACAIAPFLYMRGLYALAEQHLQRACEAAKAVGDQRGLSCALYHLGEIMRKQGDYIKAEALYRKGLTLAQQAQHREQMSILLRGIGVVAEMQGNCSQAEAAYREGLALARQLHSSELVSCLLSDLGILVAAQGDMVQAETCLQEGLHLARVLGLRERISTILTSLGFIATEQGNYTQAEVYLQEGLAVARQMGGQERIGSLLWALGKAALEQGHYLQAQSYLQEGLALARYIGNRELVDYLLLNLAMNTIEQGNYAQAEARLQEGLTLAQQIGHRWLNCTMLRYLALVAIKRGDDVQAEVYLQEGLAMARLSELRKSLSAFLADLGMLKAEQGDNIQAEVYLQEGLTIARQIDHHEWISTLLANLGTVASNRGDDAQAEAYLQQGLELAFRRGNRSRLCSLLLKWGEFSLKRQQYETAAATFHEVLAMIPEGNHELLAQTHYDLACVAVAEGNFREARQLGETSLKLFEMLDHHMACKVKQWLVTASN